MKINDINRIQGLNKYQKSSAKERELKRLGSKKDEVSISNEAKALLEQTKEASSVAKVTKLKEQIANGTYQVDAEKVAGKMLEWFNK